MNLIKKLINNRLVALALIIIITLALIQFHEITGYISKTATTQSSSYIPLIFIGIIIALIYWYKK